MTFYTVCFVRVQNEGVMLGVLTSPGVLKNKKNSICKKGKKETSETFRLSSLLNVAKPMF